MGNQRRLSRYGVGIGFVALLTLGITGGPAAAQQGSDTLVIAIPGTPQGIDLDRNSGPQSWTIAAQTLDLGMEWARVPYPYPPDSGIDNNKIPGFTHPAYTKQTAVPGLVQRCELTNDGREAVYHLRRGVISGMGNEFTADDVLWRVQRALANKAIGHFMLAAANAAQSSQWQKVDKYTVKITSPTPMPLICLINTNEYWTYPDATEAKKHVSNADPYANDWFPFNGNGFGPYYVTKWAPGQLVELDANKHYWGGAPVIKKIIYKVVPESANRVALLASGTVQMAEGLSPDDVISLSKKEGVSVAAVRSNLSIYVVMNNKEKPFDNVKVRRAINYAIPRGDIVRQVYRGLAHEWQGVMPSTYPGYVKFTGYTQNLAKAKELLSEAGYPDGFKETLTYNSGDPVQASVGVVIQTALKKIGVDLKLQPQPPGPYSDLVQSKKARFGLWLDFPIQPDPNYSLRLLYLTGNAVNYQNYSNPKVDAALERCVSFVGPTRLACHEPVEKTIFDDAPLGWIAEPDYLIGLSDKLAGWGWYTTQYYRVGTMSYAK
jgi:peptide/nickel transport system substrate-binding protein